jgi:hypothetical protein
MHAENLNRIVEVSLLKGSVRRDVGIMTVRQALELPDVPSLEYTHPEHNTRANSRLLTRDQLEAYICG